MRILIASRAFPPDVHRGSSRLVWNLWDRLRREHDVVLVAGWRRDRSLLPADARAVRLDPEHPVRARVAMEFAVRRAAMRFQPDVVLASGMEAPVDVGPTVGLIDDPFAGESAWGRMRGLRRRLWLKRISGMAAAVVPSTSARSRLQDFGIDADRVHVAWPGVDTARLLPDASVVYGDGGPIRLLYAARMVPGKGQHIAIEAVKGLHPNIRDRVHLDLVGRPEDDAYVAGLHRRAADAPIRFHHDVIDVTPFYRQAHIILFPTVQDEVFGYSAVDGMACGKPLIYSRIPTLEEVTGGVGVPVPAGDVKRFGEAIRSLIKDPERCRVLGGLGRELAVERYAWDRAAARYAAILEQAAG